MFEQLTINYSNIIKEFGIVGYSEQDIIKRGVDTKNNLQLYLLYSYPHQESEDVETIFQMMFPDDDHKIQSPKFFSLTLTDEKGNRTFLYCLKFPEKYVFTESKLGEKESNSDKKYNNDNNNTLYIEVPLVIYIKSYKEDLESFKQLLYTINQIIVSDNLEKYGCESSMINNYKKIELMNLLFFLFSLPHTSPHSLVKLQLNKELDSILNLNHNKNGNDETIDFYFSSNCEIPCNKNDTDINLLFLILDQSIIIKVLFSILTEKQIIFTASQAYILHMVISTFLKLIFPFKWHHSCITVLSKDNLELLEIPLSYIFGVLSSHLSTKDLTDEYDGKIIVDCDTNEIFGYSNLEPFEPPEILSKKIIDDKKKKDKKKEKEKEKEIEFNNLESNNFTQGNNLIIINKNVIMKYHKEINGKKKKLKFDYDNNIIIDTQKSQLFIDKNDIFIDSNDWKWLRRNIQLVRNPEIFNLDNIDIQSHNKNKYLSNDDEDNPILPNRPFSYNIQNIILTFILKKLSFKESDFMTVFKKTNLFLEYEDKSKEYENASGRRIVENIEETKNSPRSIDNSFNIEYILNSFNTEMIIDKINARINKNEKNEEQNCYQSLKKILKDYIRTKEDIENGTENNDNKIIYNRKKENARKKSINEQRRPNLLVNKLSKNLKRHVKNNTSLLQETTSQNKYILLGFDKDLDDSFQFYSENGFIYFINKFEKFLIEEKIDIEKIIYTERMNDVILNMINKCLSEENDEKSEEKSEQKEKEISDKKESSKDVNNLNKKNLRKILGVSVVPEKKEEENIENDTDRLSGGSVEIKKDEEYDLAENIFHPLNEKEEVDDKNKIFEWNEIESLEENNIIKFSNFNFDYAQIQENEKKEKNENEINHLMQYYLFLAFYLEKAKKDKLSLKYFYDNIFLKSKRIFSGNIDNNINNNNKEDNEYLYEIIEIDDDDEREQKSKINEVIIRLYNYAYNNSDKKHRDFPFYSFYNFLKAIDLKELKSLINLFDDDGDNDLNLIYRTLIIQKQQEEIKKFQKMISINTLNKKGNNDNMINRSKTEYHFEKFSSDITRNSDAEILKKKTISDKLERISPDKKRQTLYINKINLDINKENNSENINISSIDTNKSNTNNLLDKTDISTNIIEEIGEIINQEIIGFGSFVGKNNNEILEEMNIKITQNNKLHDLISLLKFLKLEKINTKKKYFVFWLNCFNYLIIYSIFHKKLNLKDEKTWKKFFNNVVYNIGGTEFSFNDMEYILFKKSYFLSSAYKPNQFVKNLNMDKLEGDFKLNEYHKLIPYILSLPIKGFLSPMLFKEENIENDVNKRIKKYLKKLVFIDSKNYLCCFDVLLKFDMYIFGKEIKKYENFFSPELYCIIKNKKYKKLIQQKILWQLDFESFLFDNDNNGINDNK